MKKLFINKLEIYVENVNKSIFDLDIEYLEENGYSNIKEIKKKEIEKILDDAFYVYNECLKTFEKPKQRFVVTFEIKQQRGNRIELTITDNKTNEKHNSCFDWYVLKSKRGFIISYLLNSWLNNTLVNLNSK